MKKFASVFFLLVLMGSYLRPLLPYIEYQINFDYIAEVLCINKDRKEMKCDGKCYLSKQVEKVAGKDTEVPPGPRSLEVLDLSDYVSAGASYLTPFASEKRNTWQAQDRYWASRFSMLPETPPPEQLFTLCS